MAMLKIDYSVLEFDHIIRFAKESLIFVAARENARENGSEHLRLFLINESTANVYIRNGQADAWQPLFGSERDTIIARLIALRNQIPTYKINSPFNS